MTLASKLQDDRRLYETLVQQLDDLISNGLGDSDAADALRDQMDGPWRRLPQAEIAAIYAKQRKRHSDEKG